MHKILASFSLLVVVCLHAQEDTYVFEAKGEFAKELKSLVEKYSKEGKIEANVYEKGYEPQSESKTITQSLLSVFDSSDAEALKYADIGKGEQIYQAKCASCHGVSAKENRYGSARVLSTLEPTEIYTQLRGYRNEEDFGGSLKYIMQPKASGLLDKDMQSIAVYIYSLNPDAPASGKASTSTPSGAPTPKTTTSQGTYLK